MGRLQDKVALVLGAGSIGPGWGNGKAAAVTFAREGAIVVAVDRNRDAAEETVGIIRGEGGRAEAVCADVSDAAAVAGFVAEAAASHGRVDLLHNNVGIMEISSTEETSEESWDRVIRVNLKSVFLSCRAVLPVMQRQGGGAIINVSSVASIRFFSVAAGSYAASKAAINQFTQTIAIEHAAHGIRCNAVLPGLMHTPMIIEPYRRVYNSIDDMVAKRHAACPMGHMGDAWDVANASLFLASDEARYITGVALPVDGGLSCRAG